MSLESLEEIKTAKKLYLKIYADVKAGKVEKVKLALARAGKYRESILTEIDGDASELLVEAATSGNREMVELLVNVGARVNQFVGFSGSLYWAAKKGNLEVVQCLVRFGADIDAQHISTGCTPLMAAIEGGHTEVALHLLELGAKYGSEIKLTEGYTTINVAASMDNAEVLVALADKGVFEGEEVTPLQFVTSYGKASRSLEALLKHPTYSQPAWDERLDTIIADCGWEAHRQVLLSWRTERAIEVAVGASGVGAPAASRKLDGPSL